MRKVCIYGAGEIGVLAKQYYSQFCDIVCFLDGDSKLWNTKVDGTIVQSPEYVIDHQYSIVVASRLYCESICTKLKQYGVKEVVVFNADETIRYLDANDENESVLRICFRGGLGNQMFEYVIYKYYQLSGVPVLADLSEYVNPRAREFLLEKVFPSISMSKSKSNNRNYTYLEKNNFDTEFVYDNQVLKMSKGALKGYFQSYKYPQIIESDIRHSFEFNVTDEKLKRDIAYVKSVNAVAVHIRRGDYLKKKNSRLFGGVCDKNYYDNAMDYISQRVENPQYIFFSDDMEWVKENFKGDNYSYSFDDFLSYEDWYSMCLMSFCKHNIIANSTFSWWGAWLNSNDDKIVIAPQKWMGIEKNVMNDICPPEWIRI